MNSDDERMLKEREHIRPFARFYLERQLKSIEDAMPSMVRTMQAMTEALPKGADGQVDDYFRGALDGAEGTLKGIVTGFQSALDQFDRSYDYIWYQWERAGNSDA